MIIAFCGHAEYTGTEDDERKILTLLTELIGNQHAELYLGGYGAFDEFARKCGKKYQKIRPNTKLIFITPYITLDYQKNHLDYEKSLYDEIVYPELEKVPLKFTVSYRNRWMVEKADCVIAYVSHGWGGAYATYKHAKRKGKKIFNLADFE